MLPSEHGRKHKQDRVIMRTELALFVCLLAGATQAVIIDPCAAAGYQDDVAINAALGDLPRNNRARFRRAATNEESRRWTNGVIPYEFANQFTAAEKAIILGAIRIWERHTCLIFVPRKTESEFVYFQSKGQCGCCSFVGRMGHGNAQGLNLGWNCVRTGTVLHELGHLIGFWHEHTRPDRDKYIRINYENVRFGEAKNFRRLGQSEIDSLGVAYDYDSIMHYARTTFSKSGFESTIVPVNNSGFLIGQRDRLSEKDILQANRLYRCPSCGRTISSSQGGLSFMSNDKPLAGVRTCAWRIIASPYEKISLVFNDTYFGFPCEKVYLEIRRGGQPISPLIGRYCKGSPVPRVLSSSGSDLWIKFFYGHKYFYDGQPIGFRANYHVSCGGKISAEKGEIQSPNYPNPYDHDLKCSWRIVVPKGRRILLQFQAFRVKSSRRCSADRLEVVDGVTDAVLGLLCSRVLPVDILSSGNQLTLTFISDSRNSDTGFLVTFSTEEDDCALNNGNCSHVCHSSGGLGRRTCSCYKGFQLDSNGRDCRGRCGGKINAPRGLLTSPGFPGNYEVSQTCTWNIVVLPSYVVVLKFDFFQLEKSETCSNNYDYVEVSDWRSGGKTKRFCGQRRLQERFVSTSNAIQVRFHSDSTITGKGFKAQFYQVKNACSVRNGGCEQLCDVASTRQPCGCRSGFRLQADEKSCSRDTCSSNMGRKTGWIAVSDHSMACAWILNTTEGQQYNLTFTSLKISGRSSPSSCSSQTIRFFSREKIWKKTFEYCGGSLPAQLTSLSNTLKVTFDRSPGMGVFGFNLSYTTGCGGRLQASRNPQLIYSHSGYGVVNYPESQNCTWLIGSRRKGRVALRVGALDTEGNPKQCRYDYVNLFDGASISSPLLKRLCGNEHQGQTIQSSGSHLLVQFVSDVSVGRGGFWMEYSKAKPRRKRGFHHLIDNSP